MARPNWLNENRNRAYPFLTGTVGLPAGPPDLRRLPRSAVVDAGFVLGQACGFVTGRHQVFLIRVRRQGGLFFFDFAGDAPLMTGAVLTFSRLVTAAGYLTEHGSSDASHNASQSAEACDDSLWSGYLVTGPLDELVDLLPADGILTRAGGAATVEPALLQNLSGAFVKALALANGERTRVTAPTDCPPVVWPYPVDVVHAGPTCLQGDLLFLPGFNCDLRQDSLENALVFSTAAGAGKGQPCTPVPLFEGEVPPPGSQLLEGGPLCNETLRSVNGVGGRFLRLLAGPGVSVEDQPDRHTVVIDISMTGFAVCAADVSQSPS